MHRRLIAEFSSWKMKVTESSLSDFFLSFICRVIERFSLCASVSLCLWVTEVVFIFIHNPKSKPLEIFMLKSSVSPYLLPQRQQVLANVRKTQKLFTSAGWVQEKYPKVPQKACKTSVKHSVFQTSWNTPLSLVFCGISSHLLSCFA